MTEKIDYHFIAVPYKITYVCDALCLAVLTILIQKESYWKEKGRLDSNGYFYTANAEIESRIGYKRNAVNETIEGLFRGNMIDIIPSSSKKESNKYRINWNTILAYDKLSLEELNHPAMRIHKVARKETLTYTLSKLDAKNETNCTTTLDKSDTINNINKDINNNDSANCTTTPNCYLPEFTRKETCDNSENEILDIFRCIVFGKCYEHKTYFTDKEHAVLKDILSQFRQERPNIEDICFELKSWSKELTREEVKKAILNIVSKFKEAYQVVAQ